MSSTGEKFELLVVRLQALMLWTLKIVHLYNFVVLLFRIFYTIIHKEDFIEAYLS